MGGEAARRARRSGAAGLGLHGAEAAAALKTTLSQISSPVDRPAPLVLKVCPNPGYVGERPASNRYGPCGMAQVPFELRARGKQMARMAARKKLLRKVVGMADL